MSAEDWLRAAQAEEQRLLGEIMKTDLYRQLDAVRAVIAVYEGTVAPAAGTAAQPTAATVVTARSNGSPSERSFKKANLFTDVSDGGGDAGLRSGPQ
jgi:hypothetical protein